MTNTRQQPRLSQQSEDVKDYKVPNVELIGTDAYFVGFAHGVLTLVVLLAFFAVVT